jgi:parallel beta-helix repeat protein
MQARNRLILFAVMYTAALLGSLVSPRATTAATYYTSPDGSDSHPGTLSQPFRTVGKGVRALSAGDTLYLRGGTYSEALVNPPSGSSWSNPVTIARYQAETVTFQKNFLNFYDSGARYVVVDGVRIVGGSGDGIIISRGTGPIRFVNFEVTRAAGQGIQVSETANPGNEFIRGKIHDNGTHPGLDHGLYISTSGNLVDGCEISHNAAYGIHLYSGNPSRNILRNNRVHHNGRLGATYSPTGILVSTGSQNLVYNNVIYDEPFYGIRVGVSGSISHNKVYNNTIYKIGAENGIAITRGSHAAEIRNNIVYQTGGAAILDEGSSTTLSHNFTGARR